LDVLEKWETIVEVVARKRGNEKDIKGKENVRNSQVALEKSG